MNYDELLESHLKYGTTKEDIVKIQEEQVTVEEPKENIEETTISEENQIDESISTKEETNEIVIDEEDHYIFIAVSGGGAECAAAGAAYPEYQRPTRSH